MNTQWLTQLFKGAWAVWVDMAPYLLFGFLVAGILSVWLSAGWVRRHLGGGGPWAALKAALVGVPLPLCSCSVIPVAASVRGHGASRGATSAFMMTTPQVGINSIVVTYGLLGPFVTLARTVVAFVSGFICGTVVDATRMDATHAQERSSAMQDVCCKGDNTEVRDMPAWVRVLRHGFITLPRDIALPILIGISISALLGAMLPPGFFTGRLEPGLTAMLLMLAIGIPMYVCSTSSVPVALALIAAGVPAGAALVFLVTGPATNTATLATLFRLLGARDTAIYIAVLVVTALLAGWVLDAWLLARQPGLVDCHMPHTAANGLQHLLGIVLLAVLAFPLVSKAAARLRSQG